MTVNRPFMERAHALLLHPLAKPACWVLCLAPLGWLLAALFMARLGPNPAEALIRGLGDWALRGLWGALAVTPLRQMTGWASLARFRRLIGLFAFFYAALHALAYAAFDMQMEPAAMWRDVADRPFILAGVLALALLLALALTSTARAQRRLGAVRWRALHRLVYVVPWVVLLHFFWMRAGKRQFDDVLLYAALMGVLLGWRVLRFMAKKRRWP